VFTKDKKLVAGNCATVKADPTLLRQYLDKRPALTSKDVAGGAGVGPKRPVSAILVSLTILLVPVLPAKEESLSSLTSTSASVLTPSVTALSTLT
jgi:hypothetical protein